MDRQLGTDLLIHAITARPATSVGQLVAGLILFASGCRQNRTVAPPDLPAVGGQATLLRVPRRGGTVEAYDPDHLAEPIWTSRASLNHIREVLGVNLESRMLLAIDTTKTLVAIDLESRGTRPLTAGVERASIVPNGSAYVLNVAKHITRYDAGTPTSYRSAAPSLPQFQFGTFNDRFVGVVGTAPPKLVIWSADGELKNTTIAAGERAATYWGDLFAVAADDRVSLYDTNEPFGVESITISDHARHLTFSPSGHRLYVTREKPDIQVYDRFSHERLSQIPLPGVPSAIRTDLSGRWMLARPTNGDSVWVVDLATGRLSATMPGDWDDDLPTVAGGSVFIGRESGDLVARDLSKANRPEVGRVEGGGLDFWSVTTWVPRERLVKAAAAAESALVTQDSMLVKDSAVTAAQADRLYLQVSSSQNADWSKELVRQLSAAGYPAHILNPGTVDEGYRVVLGPYRTRDEAEEIGRKLGRPYFVLTNPKIDPR